MPLTEQRVAQIHSAIVVEHGNIKCFIYPERLSIQPQELQEYVDLVYGQLMAVLKGQQKLNDGIITRTLQLIGIYQYGLQAIYEGNGAINIANADLDRAASCLFQFKDVYQGLLLRGIKHFITRHQTIQNDPVCKTLDELEQGFNAYIKKINHNLLQTQLNQWHDLPHTTHWFETDAGCVSEQISTISLDYYQQQIDNCEQAIVGIDMKADKQSFRLSCLLQHVDTVLYKPVAVMIDFDGTITKCFLGATDAAMIHKSNIADFVNEIIPFPERLVQTLLNCKEKGIQLFIGSYSDQRDAERGQVAGVPLIAAIFEYLARQYNNSNPIIPVENIIAFNPYHHKVGKILHCGIMKQRLPCSILHPRQLVLFDDSRRNCQVARLMGMRSYHINNNADNSLITSLTNCFDLSELSMVYHRNPGYAALRSTCIGFDGDSPLRQSTSEPRLARLPPALSLFTGAVEDALVPIQHVSERGTASSTTVGTPTMKREKSRLSQLRKHAAIPRSQSYDGAINPLRCTVKTNEQYEFLKKSSQFDSFKQVDYSRPSWCTSEGLSGDDEELAPLKPATPTRTMQQYKEECAAASPLHSSGLVPATATSAQQSRSESSQNAAAIIASQYLATSQELRAAGQASPLALSKDSTDSDKLRSSL